MWIRVCALNIGRFGFRPLRDRLLAKVSNALARTSGARAGTSVSESGEAAEALLETRRTQYHCLAASGTLPTAA